jgi:hypothetical protein
MRGEHFGNIGSSSCTMMRVLSSIVCVLTYDTQRPNTPTLHPLLWGNYCMRRGRSITGNLQKVVRRKTRYGYSHGYCYGCISNFWTRSICWVSIRMSHNRWYNYICNYIGLYISIHHRCYTAVFWFIRGQEMVILLPEPSTRSWDVTVRVIESDKSIYIYT